MSPIEGSICSSIFLLFSIIEHHYRPIPPSEFAFSLPFLAPALAFRQSSEDSISAANRWYDKIVKSDGLLYLVDVELGHLEEDVSVATFHEGGLETVLPDERLEVPAVGHFPEVHSAEVLEHGLHDLHDAVHQGAFLVEGQEEVDFAFLAEFA